VVVPTAARFLDAAEQSEAMTVYHGSLDFTKILITDSLGFLRRKFTVAVPLSIGSHVVIIMGDLCSWVTRPRSATLIHELAHAWQSQHYGSDPEAFMKNSVECQIRALAAAGDVSAYAYVPGKPFGSTQQTNRSAGRRRLPGDRETNGFDRSDHSFGQRPRSQPR
jgi:hypothetical protein